LEQLLQELRVVTRRSPMNELPFTGLDPNEPNVRATGNVYRGLPGVIDFQVDPFEPRRRFHRRQYDIQHRP